jgi:hypothetical protein
MPFRAQGIGTTLGTLVIGLILGVLLGPVLGSFILSSPDDYVKRVEAWGALFGGITASFTLLFLTWALIEGQREKEERLVLDHYNAIASQLTAMGQYLPFHVFHWDAAELVWQYKRTGRGIMELSRELAAQKLEQTEGLDRVRDVAVPISLLFGYCGPAQALRESIEKDEHSIFSPISAMLDFIYPEHLRDYYMHKRVLITKLDDGLAIIRRAVEADDSVRKDWRELLEKGYMVYALPVDPGSKSYKIVAEPIEAIAIVPPVETDGDVGVALREIARAARAKEKAHD